LSTPDSTGAVGIARFRAGLWCFLIAFAALHIWVAGSYVNPDGVSYLDIADAYRRGNWGSAINGYWSPMYSWILAGWLGLVKPAPFTEPRSVHFLGLFIFVASLAAFEFFLSELLTARGKRTGRAPDLVPAVPDREFRLLAYGVFLWAWFHWFNVVITPDLLMTVFVYLAAGLLLRIRAGEGHWPTFALLGVCLALAYMAKTAMFPLSFIFLGTGWLASRRRPNAGRLVLAAVASFFLVAMPWIATLSMAKGRVTFGDAGKINYVIYANDVDEFSAAGLVHPTRRALEHPALYAIPGKAAGSYPFHYDPSYWSEGLKPRFDLKGQLKASYRCARDVATTVFDQSFLFVGVFILGFVFWQGGKGLKDGLDLQWVILLPAASGIAMYSLVHVEPRLIGVFVVLIWVGLYAAVYREAAGGGAAVGRAVPLAILLAMGISVGPSLFWTTYSGIRRIGSPAIAPASRDWEVARSLAALGVRPGDKVAKIGHGNAYWARLAGVQIVAEVHSDKEDFDLVPDIGFLLGSDGSLTAGAVSGFVSTGARAIVAPNVPPNVAEHGWTKLGKNDVGTADLYAYVLPRARETQSEGPQS
jgi:hypothetical protein